MNEKIKQLTQELGKAIDEAINESEKIKDVTAQLRDIGYEPLLMVEATICFARLPKLGDQPKSSQQLSEMMSREDLQFLKSLKISIE